MQKHITYSKGLYFTDDLKRLNELMEAEGFKTSNDLDFSYALDQKLKIKFDDIKKASDEEKKKQQEEGATKNQDAFNKMKEMVSGNTLEESKGVFEYKADTEEIRMVDDEEDDDDIPCDFEDDDPLEYSAEHLEEFMTELKSQKGGNEMAQTEKSEHLISNFLQNVKSKDPNKTSGKKPVSLSASQRGGGAPTLTNSLAYSPTNASPKLKPSKMESIESEDEPSSSQENDPHAHARKQTKQILQRIEADRKEYGHPPEAFEISNIYESQEVNLELSSKEGIQKYLSHQMMLFHFNYDFETDTIMTDENGTNSEDGMCCWNNII